MTMIQINFFLYIIFTRYMDLYLVLRFFFMVFFESLNILLVSKWMVLVWTILCILGMLLILVWTSYNLINLNINLKSKNEKEIDSQFIFTYTLRKFIISTLFLFILGLILISCRTFLAQISVYCHSNVVLAILLVLLCLGSFIFYKKIMKKFIYTYKGKYIIFLKMFFYNWLFLIVLRILLIGFASFMGWTWMTELLTLTLFNVIFLPCFILLPGFITLENLFNDYLFNYYCIYAQPTDGWETGGSASQSEEVAKRPRMLSEWQASFEDEQTKWPRFTDPAVLNMTVDYETARAINLALGKVTWGDGSQGNNFYSIYYDISATYAIPFKDAHLVRCEDRPDITEKYSGLYVDIGKDDPASDDELAIEIYHFPPAYRKPSFIAERRQGNRYIVHRFALLNRFKNPLYIPSSVLMVMNKDNIIEMYDPLKNDHGMRELWLATKKENITRDDVFCLGRTPYCPLNNMNKIVRLASDHSPSYLNIPNPEVD